MGELEPWIDENFIRSLWYGMGEQVSVKMIRDKFTGCAVFLSSLATVSNLFKIQRRLLLR
jgi:hypothetical protein